MDVFTRLVLISRFFRIGTNDLRLKAARMAARSGGRYGSRSNVDNLFVRENSRGNLTIANRAKAPPILDELIRETLRALCQEQGAMVDLEAMRLNAPIDDFLDALQWSEAEGQGLSVNDMLDCLPENEQHLVSTFANLGVGEALKLPTTMRLNKSELVELLSPWCGKYALYRFSSTRRDELELSEELFEIAIPDTSVCRLYGHGGGFYEGVLIFGGDGITATMNHASHKGRNHVFFFVTMLLGPIFRRDTYLASLVMHSEFNELRVYNTVLVRKDDDFHPRGKDVRDTEAFLTYYPVLTHRHTRMEIRDKDHDIVGDMDHPVSVTRRSDADELIQEGLALRDIYKAHPEAFSDAMLNAEVLIRAKQLQSA